MASVIDLRENPVEQMAVVQGVGGGISDMLNAYRSRKMQQRVIGVLNDHNIKAEDKRKILLGDADFLRSPMGQKLMLYELDYERRQQLQWQQQYNQVRIQKEQALADWYQRRPAAGVTGAPSQTARLSFAGKMVLNGDWNAQQAQDYVEKGQWPTKTEKSTSYAPIQPGNLSGKPLPTKEGELWRTVPMQTSGFGAPGIEAVTPAGPVIPKTEKAASIYQLEEPGRPVDQEEFERTVTELEDEEMARRYYEKWAHLWQ